MTVLGGVEAKRLPPAGRRFVNEFGTSGRAEGIDPFAIYAAQAAEVMLDAIARSDGTRVSVTRELLATRVRDGLLGSFRFDRNGDTTRQSVTLLRPRRAGGGRAIIGTEGSVVVRVIDVPTRLASLARDMVGVSSIPGEEPQMPWVDIKLYDTRVNDESVPKIVEAVTQALHESSGAATEHIHVLVRRHPAEVLGHRREGARDLSGFGQPGARSDRRHRSTRIVFPGYARRGAVQLRTGRQLPEGLSPRRSAGNHREALSDRERRGLHRSAPLAIRRAWTSRRRRRRACARGGSPAGGDRCGARRPRSAGAVTVFSALAIAGLAPGLPAPAHAADGQPVPVQPRWRPEHGPSRW